MKHQQWAWMICAGLSYLFIPEMGAKIVALIAKLQCHDFVHFQKSMRRFISMKVLGGGREKRPPGDLAREIVDHVAKFWAGTGLSEAPLTALTTQPSFCTPFT
jgi:hypothetical protein